MTLNIVVICTHSRVSEASVILLYREFLHGYRFVPSRSWTVANQAPKPFVMGVVKGHCYTKNGVKSHETTGHLSPVIAWGGGPVRR